MKPYCTYFNTNKKALKVITQKIRSFPHELKSLPEISTEVSNDNYIDSNMQYLLIKTITPSFLHKSALTWRKRLTKPSLKAGNSDKSCTKLISFEQRREPDKDKTKSRFIEATLFTQKINETLKKLKTSSQQNVVKNKELNAVKQELKDKVIMLKQPRNYNKRLVKSFNAIKRLKIIKKKNRIPAKECAKNIQLELLSTRIERRLKEAYITQRSICYSNQAMKSNLMTVFVSSRKLLKSERKLNTINKASIGVNTDKPNNSLGGEMSGGRLVVLSKFVSFPKLE